MITETATEAKTRFGQILEKSQKEPVLIEKSGREYSVLLSYEEYKRLSALEDSYWVQMANAAKTEGFVGNAESQSLLEALANAKD